MTEKLAELQPSLTTRRDRLVRLRRVAAQMGTADVLDRQAARSPSAALAQLLRERAALHRRIAAQVRAG